MKRRPAKKICCLAALEWLLASSRLSRRQEIVWTTGQYLSITQQPAKGRKVTQGRVVDHLGDQAVITILGVCGARYEQYQGTWETAPAAPDLMLANNSYARKSRHRCITTWTLEWHEVCSGFLVRAHLLKMEEACCGFACRLFIMMLAPALLSLTICHRLPVMR